MATWNPIVVTTRGLSQVTSAALSGEQVNVTKVKTSNADFSSVDLASLTALPVEKQGVPAMSVVKIDDTTVRINALFNNVGVTESYKITAFGIYAQVNDGDEFLLAVKTAITPDTVPVISNGVVKTSNYSFLIQVSSSENIAVKVDMSVYVTRSMCNDLAHPVGSYHMCDGSYEPADKFGGTWEKIDGKYVMASGTYNGKTVKAGDIVGESSHEFSLDEMAPHSHTRGTMEITGEFWADDSVYNSWYGPLKGAFGKGDYIGRGDLDSGGDRYNSGMVKFTASKGWTGHTSIEGKGKAVPVMPEAIVMDIWHRTA